MKDALTSEKRPDSAPRGVSPKILLEQVKNTAPYLEELRRRAATLPVEITEAVARHVVDSTNWDTTWVSARRVRSPDSGQNPDELEWR